MASRADKVALSLGATAGAAIALIAGLQDAEANHPNVQALILSYYPSNGWSAVAHSQGHNGYGQFDFPAWFTSANVPAGTWSNPEFGFQGCADNRWNNMVIARNQSVYSTVGQPELGDWPSGLQMSNPGCNVSPGAHDSFTVWYYNTQTGTGGYTLHAQAPQSSCTSIGLSWPCGDWAVMVEVQKSYWDNASDENRQRLLLHEWGHSWGRGDACYSEASHTHNGADCSWPSAMGYQVVDRQALFAIYGN